MLEPAERNYPIHVTVLAQAKVQDLIGLICWKYTLEHGQHKLKWVIKQVLLSFLTLFLVMVK
jgi:hypothetical protein